MNTNNATYQWLAAWVVFLAILMFLNKTRIGSVLIYWSLVMILLVLLVTQAPFIARVMSPIGSPIPGNQAGPPQQPGDTFHNV